MERYSEIVKKLQSQVERIEFKKVSWRDNQRADELSKALSGDHIPEMWLEPLNKKSIDKSTELLCINTEDNWMIPIKNYKLIGSLPLDAREA